MSAQCVEFGADQLEDTSKADSFVPQSYELLSCIGWASGHVVGPLRVAFPECALSVTVRDGETGRGLSATKSAASGVMHSVSS